MKFKPGDIIYDNADIELATYGYEVLEIINHPTLNWPMYRIKIIKCDFNWLGQVRDIFDFVIDKKYHLYKKLEKKCGHPLTLIFK